LPLSAAAGGGIIYLLGFFYLVDKTSLFRLLSTRQESVPSPSNAAPPPSNKPKWEDVVVLVRI
jgi:hypothetical protein